jgi:hypothetical protein
MQHNASYNIPAEQVCRPVATNLASSSMRYLDCSVQSAEWKAEQLQYV